MRFVLMTLPDGTAIESVLRDREFADHVYAITNVGETLAEFTTISQVADYLRRTHGGIDDLLLVPSASETR